MVINYFLERWKRWQHHSGLKQTYFVLGGIASLFLIVLLIILSIKFIGKINDETTFRDIAIALFATLSGLGVLFGFYTSIIRTETAEQGLITDRINKAVEGLGKSENGEPVIEVRIGALLSLERIAQDSLRDHMQVLKMLCAYIRHNSAKPHQAGEEKIHDTAEIKNKRKKNAGTKIDDDIQTALTIIGQRLDGAGGKERLKKEESQKYHMNLLGCNFYRAHLIRADLSCAILMASDLRGAYLGDANLNNTAFSSANMRGACLEMASLDGADFTNTKMTTAYAYKGDFSNCKNLTQEQLNEMYCGLGVNIPTKLNRPDHWPTDDESWNVFNKKFNDWRDSKYPPLHKL